MTDSMEAPVTTAQMMFREPLRSTSMPQRSRIIRAVLLVMSLLVVVGCRATRSPETDALFRAIRAGSPDTVSTLLSSPQVDVNAVDEHGNTPLIEAARLGHDKIAAELLIAHADISKKNDEGKTALMLASEGGHDETVRVLTAAGASR